MGASEQAVVHSGLKTLQALSTTPISIIKNGTYLRISKHGVIRTEAYRLDYRRVWSGQTSSSKDFSTISGALADILCQAVAARIPKDGSVATLCSGGVDSSLITTLVVKILKKKKQLNRLKIFTVGNLDLKSSTEENDLEHVLLLLRQLGLDPKYYLTIIPAEAVKKYQARVLRAGVFCTQPRLITPNPVLNSQVRHTVLMSTVLALINQWYPDIKSIITGDGADELFAGYDSMWQHAHTATTLRTRIIRKLSDFPLNDAARVALSAYHGAVLVGRNILDNEMAHPIEIRMPYTSHLVLRVLREASPHYLVGKFNGQLVSKYLLRTVALQ